MDRFINADKMIADTEAMRAISEAVSIDGIVKYINECATADVEEVVRCKDCKNCDKVSDYELWCCGYGMPYRLTTADDFCSRGAKMGNGQRR